MKATHTILIVGAAGVAAYIAAKGVKGSAAGVGGALVNAVTGLVGGAYDAIPDAIKPTSSENVFFKASNVPGQIISGNSDWTAGGWLHDILHGTPETTIDPALQRARDNVRLYGGTVQGWLGYDYIDQGAVDTRDVLIPTARKWGTYSGAGWPWER